MRLRRTTRGFTLVELLAVLIIISVMSALIIPKMLSSSDSTSLREAAHRMLIVTRFGHEYAVTHHCEVRLVLDREKGSYLLQYRKDTLDPEEDPYAQVPMNKIGETLPDGLKFLDVNIELSGNRAGGDVKDIVTFDASGEADAASIQITNGKLVWTIQVAPATGRAEIFDKAVADPPSERLDLDEQTG